MDELIMNGEPVGTEDFARRLEAIQIRIMSKGEVSEIISSSPNVTDLVFLQK